MKGLKTMGLELYPFRDCKKKTTPRAPPHAKFPFEIRNVRIGFARGSPGKAPWLIGNNGMRKTYPRTSKETLSGTRKNNVDWEGLWRRPDGLNKQAIIFLWEKGLQFASLEINVSLISSHVHGWNFIATFLIGVENPRKFPNCFGDTFVSTNKV
ncbi:hypothetical protein CEXT_49121 [Caerostris extrusa]|uniref:Uncharacterized protein n=1 Tax=Caerostris extrusa TaxID=172846 RepID=A0AAV4Y2G9_CAEEX|nr:hypothetical protein CEXT_49121 [Caerostris extrusa]